MVQYILTGINSFSNIAFALERSGLPIPCHCSSTSCYICNGREIFQQHDHASALPVQPIASPNQAWSRREAKSSSGCCWRVATIRQYLQLSTHFQLISPVV